VQASGGDDDWRLGVVLAHLVTAVVALGAGEISLAPLGLAPRRVVAIGVPPSRREVGPVAEVEAQLRGREARHVLLRGAHQGGEVVLGRGLRHRLLVVGLVGGAPAEVVAAVGVAAGEVVGGGGSGVELEDVVAGDGGRLEVGGSRGGVGRGEERQGVGLQVVAELLVLPLDAALLLHDWEQLGRRRRRAGGDVGELIAGVGRGSRYVHHLLPFFMIDRLSSRERGAHTEKDLGRRRGRGKDTVVSLGRALALSLLLGWTETLRLAGWGVELGMMAMTHTYMRARPHFGVRAAGGGGRVLFV
jgi:hypothetical protein